MPLKLGQDRPELGFKGLPGRVKSNLPAYQKQTLENYSRVRLRSYSRERTRPREDKKGVPVELENVTIVSVQVDADSRIFCKEALIL